MFSISLFGRLRMDNDGVPLKPLSPAKLVSLFAYLLLNSGPLPRETLCRALWPDLGDAPARARLRRHLHLLHRLLPPKLPAEPWLIIRDDSVQWNPRSEYRLDTAQFVQAVNNPHRLAEAVALYEGELLAEVDEDWLSAHRAYLRELYIGALRELVGQLRQERKYNTALIYVQRLRRAEPLEESAVRLVMVMRYAVGERAAAIAEYEEFARYLDVELGIEPMPETTALYEAITSKVRFPSAAQGESLAAFSTASLGRAHPTLPFVARETELGQLKSLWEQAAGGQGRVVLIGGEAGIGKTRLSAELSSYVAAEGGRVLYGDTAAPARPPYQALITALRGAIPLLAESMVSSSSLAALLPLLPELSQLRPHLRPLPHIAQERERDRIYMSIRDCLTAVVESRPLLLILEDLHWAGPATISLLKYLAPYFTNMPILLLITYREEEMGRSHPLRALRQSLVAHGSKQQIMLTRLGLAAATQAVAHISGLQIDAEQMQRLHRDSEGNPLFLSELVSSLLEAKDGQVVVTSNSDAGLPLAIRHVVAERIRRLRPNTRLIAEIASVVGVAFSVELVREVSGLEELQVLAAIDEMLDRALIREAGGQLNHDYTFTHHLIQESIYQGIEPGVRHRRHRRLALVLEDLYAAQLKELAADLARHFDQGGEGERAVPYYLNAAQTAASLYADDEALSAVNRVLAISSDLRLRWQASALGASIAQRQGNREAERQAIAQMAAIAEQLGEADWACEALRRHIHLASTLGERDEQARLVATLHSRAQASGKPYWRAVALEEEANLYLQLSQYQQTRERATAAISLYQISGDSRAQLACYCLLVECVVHLGLFAEAQEILAVATSLSTPDDRAMLVMVLTTAGKAAVMQNDFGHAKQLGEQLLELCRSIQDKEGEAAALSIIATAIASTTWAEEALDYFDQARRLCAQLGKRSGEVGALSNAGIFAVHVGRYLEGRAMMEEASRMYNELSNPRGQVVCQINIATSFIRQGDYPAAIVASQRGLELARTMNSPYLESNLLVNLGYAKLELGENEEAATYLEAALARQREVALDREMPTTLSHLAMLYLRSGNLPLAQRHITEATRLYETRFQNAPAGPDYPQYIYWVAGCLAQQQGNTSAAAQYLDQAKRHLERELAAFAGEAARSAYHDISINRSLLVALAGGGWPEDNHHLHRLPACPQCDQRSRVIRAGLNPSGSQRYRCQCCKLYFTAQRKAHGYDNSLRLEAQDLTNLGLSSREVARRLGVSHRSVMNWVHNPPPPADD